LTRWYFFVIIYISEILNSLTKLSAVVGTAITTPTMSGTSRKQSFPRARLGVPFPPMVGFVRHDIINPKYRKDFTDAYRMGAI